MLRYLPVTQVACNYVVCFSWRAAVITFNTHEYARNVNPVGLYATMKVKEQSFNVEKNRYSSSQWL